MMKHLRYALAILGLGRGYELVLRPENQELRSRMTDVRGYIAMFLASVITLLLNVNLDVLKSGWIIGLTISMVVGLLMAITRIRQTHKDFTHIYATSDRSNSLGLLASKWAMFKWRLRDTGRTGTSWFSWRFRFTFLDPNRSAMLRIDPHWDSTNTRSKEQIALAMKSKEGLWKDHRENDSLFRFTTDLLIWCYKWRWLAILVIATTYVVSIEASSLKLAIINTFILGIWYFVQDKLCDLIHWSRKQHVERQARVTVSDSHRVPDRDRSLDVHRVV